jgi:hypothetical protein
MLEAQAERVEATLREVVEQVALQAAAPMARQAPLSRALQAVVAVAEAGTIMQMEVLEAQAVLPPEAEEAEELVEPQAVLVVLAEEVNVEFGRYKIKKNNSIKNNNQLKL